MSSLILVRHGQASLFTDDYDRLSDLGQAQARRLGEYWVRRRLQFDEVFVGPRLRQQATAEIVASIFHAARLPWPKPCVAHDLDEYDIRGLFGSLAKELAAESDAFADLVAQVRQAPETDVERARNFQRLLGTLTLHWLACGESARNVETWPRFRQRVDGALRRILGGEGRGRRIVCFTSGGWIGVALHLILGAPERMALEMSWRIRNCSLTEFAFTTGRVTPDTFNAVPHLEDAALWTYR